MNGLILHDWREQNAGIAFSLTGEEKDCCAYCACKDVNNPLNCWNDPTDPYAWDVGILLALFPDLEKDRVQEMCACLANVLISQGVLK